VAIAARLNRMRLVPINMLAPSSQEAAPASPQDVLESRHRSVNRQDMQCVCQVVILLAKSVVTVLTPIYRHIWRSHVLAPPYVGAGGIRQQNQWWAVDAAPARCAARVCACSAIVARQLNIAIATLDMHKTRIFDKCRIAWALPETKRLSHRFLYEVFGDLADVI